MHRFAMSVLTVCAVLVAASASAQTKTEEPGELDLPRVIALAAEQSPAARIGRTQVAEAEGRLTGADVRSLDNPTVGAALGPRIGSRNGLDVDLTLEVPVELGGRRTKRVSAAAAGLAREKHRVDDLRREAIATAVRAYYRALRAEESVRLAQEQKRLAEELLGAAQARYEAGQVPRLEVNLAYAQVARAGSHIATEQVGAARTKAELALALGLPSTGNLRPVGELRDRSVLDSAGSVAAPEDRADVLAALSDVRAAEAEAALAEAERLPELAFTAGYAREEDANVLLAGVSLSLPLFNPHKGAVLEAEARKQRARVEAETRRVVASAQVEGAREAYGGALEAVRLIEAETLPRAFENEKLTLESYRAGKIGLPTLLQVRREVLEARRAYLDTLLEAAEAGTDLVSALGSFPTRTNPTR
ncbi:MAG: TolC family protein [Deltaproteobacteria bacterium]|nr:TolC family protein [Deltaproteobacteria bacterium]